jgi:serine/threonine protein kinase
MSAQSISVSQTLSKTVLTFKDVPINNSDTIYFAPSRVYSIIDFLGKGSYSRVYKAKNLSTQEIVALKVSHLAKEFFITSKIESRIAQRISQLPEASLRYLLKIKDSFSAEFREGVVHVQVYEVMTTSLTACLINKSSLISVPFSLKFIQKVLSSLFQAIDTMHKNNLAHRDLKPCNILIDDSLEVKVADYGSSEEIQGFISSDHFNFQTIWYRAPEVFLKNPYSKAIDIWSLGCIAAELYQGSPLFTKYSEKEMLEVIFDQFGAPPDSMVLNPEYRLIIDELPPKESYKETSQVRLIQTLTKTRGKSTQMKEEEATTTFIFMNLLQKLLKLNPLERITADEALKHPFFKKTII